jgi:hypothetical protein
VLNAGGRSKLLQALADAQPTPRQSDGEEEEDEEDEEEEEEEEQDEKEDGAEEKQT